MVGSAICLFVCLFVLFIAIPMELIRRASACPLEPDLVSWAKPHPYSAAARLEMSAKEGINPPAACGAPLRERSLLSSQDTSTQEHIIIK